MFHYSEPETGKTEAPAAREEDAVDIKIRQSPMRKYGELTESQRTTLAQTELTHLGCDPGPIDGQIGRKTRSAFARFVDIAQPDAVGPTPTDPASIEAMVATSEKVCAATWVAKNRPSKLSGSWVGVAVCTQGPNRVNLTAEVIHKQGRSYSAVLLQSIKLANGRTVRAKQNSTFEVYEDGSLSGMAFADGNSAPFQGRLSDSGMELNSWDEFCRTSARMAN